MEKRENTLKNFVDYLQKTKGLSERTIYHYMTYHTHFMDQEITQKSINKFIQSKNNNSVCRGYLLSYLEFLGLTKEFDIPKSKSGTKKKKMIRDVSLADFNRVRDHAYNFKKKHGIILDLVFYGALRRMEILDLRINSFNWDKWLKDPSKPCEFRVTGKGKKDRMVVVHPKATMTLLEIYLEKGVINANMTSEAIVDTLNSYHTLLFRHLTEKIVYDIIQKHSKKVLGRDIRPHELRHSRATQLEDQGVSIRDIQRYLGHSSTAITEIYLHTSETRSLSNVVDATSQII